MYCPGCGLEATEDQNYCRKCGVNLTFVTKAVTIGNSVARGNSGLLPKIRSMMGNLKLDTLSEQISQQLDQINRGLEGANGEARTKEHESAPTAKRAPKTPEFFKPKKKTDPNERRARLLERGFPSFFSGIALMIFLYVLGSSIVLRIPPETAANVPFEIESVAHIVWLVGLIPLLSGLGRIIAAFSIPTTAQQQEAPPLQQELPPPPQSVSWNTGSLAEDLQEPPSVTEHTTHQLPPERLHQRQ